MFINAIKEEMKDEVMKTRIIYLFSVYENSKATELIEGLAAGIYRGIKDVIKDVEIFECYT